MPHFFCLSIHQSFLRFCGDPHKVYSRRAVTGKTYLRCKGLNDAAILHCLYVSDRTTTVQRYQCNFLDLKLICMISLQKSGTDNFSSSVFGNVRTHCTGKTFPHVSNDGKCTHSQFKTMILRTW